MKRVLVTGATGFIGRQALSPLLARGYEVHALHTKVPVDSDRRVRWHQADLLAENEAERICNIVQPSHVLHFAWYVNPADYRTSSENERWVAASLSLLRAFQKNNGTRAVFAGSAMEYDPALQTDFLDETAPTANHNAYASAKNQTRELAESYATESGISFAWGRVFNIYGPHESPARLVPQVINALLANREPAIPTGGVTLDYSFVVDTAQAFIALLESETNATVNIASGNPVSLRQLAHQIAELMEKTELVSSINEKLPKKGPARVVAGIAKLTDEIGFRPQYDLRQGLTETIAWWRAARAKSIAS